MAQTDVKDIFITFLLHLNTITCRDTMCNFIVTQSKKITGETTSALFKNKKSIGRSGLHYQSAFSKLEDGSCFDGKYYRVIKLDNQLKWVLEYKTEVDLLKHKPATQLLVEAYEKKLKSFSKSTLNLKKILYYVLIIACVSSLFYFKVPDKAIATAKVELTTEPVRSSIAGIIKYCVQDNAVVKRGDLLIEIETEETILEKATKQEKLYALQLELDNLERISRDDFSKVADVALKKSEIKQVKLNLELLDYSLSKSKIFAEEAGVVKHLNTFSPQGAQVEPGEEIVHLEIKPLKVVANLNSTDISLFNDNTSYIFYSNRTPDKYENLTFVEKSTEPVLSIDNGMSYELTLSAPDNLDVGDAGVVHLYNDKVTLIYYAFKKALIKFNGF